MTDPLIVLRKLGLLGEHAARVRRRRPPAMETFRGDVEIQDALAMSLLVAVQEAVDQGFELLAEHGILDPNLAWAMTRVTALRNRLAHGYASVDADRLWAELPSGLDALDRFAKSVAEWLEQKP